MGAVTDLLDNGSAVGDSIQKASRPDSAQGVQHGPVLRQLHSGGTGREATGHARWFERFPLTQTEKRGPGMNAQALSVLWSSRCRR
jgi:hypothetical protein